MPQMVKQKKGKDTVAKKDINKKDKNDDKKEKRKENKSEGTEDVDKSVGKVPKRCGVGICKIIFLIWLFVKVVMVSYAAYKLYVELTVVPDMPVLDVDEWWTNTDKKTQDISIRRYKPLFTDVLQEQLRLKFDLYRSIIIKKQSLNESWTYGTNSIALGQMFAHWQYKYVLRDRVKFLNQFEHFKTNIQGLDIHFMHVKPKVEKNVKVVPLLLLHGWPSTFRDFYDMIPVLTTPQDGYDFVFEVIVPSLPGFVYSQAPTRPGMGPMQIAIIMANLMKRLGLEAYYVHGSGLSHIIGTHMATYFDKEVLGLHTTFPVNYSKLSILTWVLGGIWPSLVGQGLEDRMYPLNDKKEFFLEESGYMHLQGTKPDTIGIALSDSPVGLLSYFIDRYVIFTNPENKYVEDGNIAKYYDMTALIDNVMLYYSTNSVTTSLRLFKESFESTVEKTMIQIPTPVPTWGLRAKHELFHQPDFMLRWKYPNLVGTTTLDFGGHFVALEKPKEVALDLFLSVKKISVT